MIDGEVHSEERTVLAPTECFSPVYATESVSVMDVLATPVQPGLVSLHPGRPVINYWDLWGDWKE